MQDRFKSRIWDKTTRTMHYNDFVITATGYVAKLEDLPEVARKRGVKLNAGVFLINQTNIDFDKNCTVMLSTGLKDKNGKLIFEGDVLNVNTGSRDTSGYGVVEYLQCGCKFIVNGFLENPSGYYSRRKSEFYQNLQEWLRTEIIGNIYQNPELWEEQC